MPTSRRDFIKRVAAGSCAVALTPNAASASDAMKPVPYRVGKWLSSDQTVLNNWLSAQITQLEISPPSTLHPTVQALKDKIESDGRLYALFVSMFVQVPFKKTPTGEPQVRTYEQALGLINNVLKTAPEYNKTGLVGFPINAILDWAMGTEAGFTAFQDPEVNRLIQKILEAWGTFLASPESVYVLNEDPKTGWFGSDALQKMQRFSETFICNPALPHWGFTSWDDFFTRQFRPGVRPVEFENDDRWISNSCESAPYKIAKNVKAVDKFWIKAQPYSLRHMLNKQDYLQQFVGGTVYQAFLSALSYHRWHSPINGTIVDAYNLDGTYYSETRAVGFDPAAPNNSQGYITAVAARSVILIRSSQPGLGLVALIQVGMAEVSSCEITVKPGDLVRKGDQLGMFHFGGSTYCLIVGPQVNLKFNLGGRRPGVHASNIPLNAALAEIVG